MPLTLSIDPVATVSGFGLAVTATGAGGISITNGGSIIVDAGNAPSAGGTAALSLTAAGGPITYTGGSIINNGSGDAVNIQNDGAGTVTVDIAGASSSASGEGILVRDTAAGGDISVTAGAVTALAGSRDAIDIQAQSTTADVTVVANGGLAAGNAGVVAVILAAAGTGNIDVTTNGAIDARFGIDAENFGSGFTRVTTIGPVTTTTGNGIFALTTGGAVTVTAGDVTSTGDTAIIARRTAAAGAGAISVTAGNVSGTTGIEATNAGTGTTSIIANGTVQGTAGAISASSATGNAINVTLNGTTRNSSASVDTLAIRTVGGPTTLDNFGSLVGRVEFGAVGDALINRGIWNTGGTNQFGAGADILLNNAGATLRTAHHSGVLELTTFDGLETVTSAGVVTMQDGGGGDVTFVSGVMTLSPGSTMAIDAGGATPDLLHTGGAATITGSTLSVRYGGGLIDGTRYTVLTADGGLTGTFGALTIAGAFASFTDAYDLNNAYLDYTRLAFVTAGGTPNQIATALGLDSIPQTGPMVDALASIGTLEEARNALDQLSGEVHASAKGARLNDSRFLRDAATARIRAAFGDTTATALPVMAYGEDGAQIAAPDTNRFAVWGQAFGALGRTDGDGNAAAFRGDTGGLLFGADIMAGTWRVGLIGGYSRSSFNVPARNSSGTADSYHLGIYGGTNWGALALRGGAAYSLNNLATSRTVAFNGFAEQLSASYNAGEAQVFGEFAYRAELGRANLEPFANAAYVNLHTSSFTEAGGAAALSSFASTMEAAFTTVGLRASTDFSVGGVQATARGMIGWRHAFSAATPTSTFAFAGGNNFLIAGAPIARDTALVEAGMDFRLSPTATLGLSYSGMFGKGLVQQGAKIDLAMKF